MMAPSPPVSREGQSSSDPRDSVAGSNLMRDTQGPRLRAPRTLPPWIDSYEENHGPVSHDQLHLLRPPAAVPAHHNAAPDDPQRRVSKDGFVYLEDSRLGPAQTARAKIPHFLRYGRASRRGRKWDHLRTAEPVIVHNYTGPTINQDSAAWSDFVRSSRWGPLSGEESEVVEPGYLEKLQPNFNNPAIGGYNALDVRNSRRTRTKTFSKRMWNLVMRGSLSPLLFRLIVMVTSILALAIAGRIYVLEDNYKRDSAERTQSVVAIVVDCVAIPYIGYMIWDEYTGKPLGLRSGVSKISLIMLDLFFHHLQVSKHGAGV